MCEILVLLEDQVGDNFYANIGLFKRGDVLCCFEDGWQWGSAEYLPPFRIFKLPNLSVSTGRLLVATEQPTDPYRDKRLLRQRMYALDLDHPLLDGSLADEHVLSVVTKKQPHVDPNAIGGSPHEIGPA